MLLGTEDRHSGRAGGGGVGGGGGGVTLHHHHHHHHAGDDGPTPGTNRDEQGRGGRLVTNGALMDAVAYWDLPTSSLTDLKPLLALHHSRARTKARTCRDGHWLTVEPLPTRLQAIRCTVPTCTCDCFSPSSSKGQIRNCDTCKHGWVAHALDKLGFRHLYNCNQVEIVQPNIVFDIASLMLYGCHATPVRLKILLDRLFSVLQHEEVLQVLHGFGWKYEDYARGYILQDSQGSVLDRWTVATKEEELLILQQFLRFGETRQITQQILLHETSRGSTESSSSSSSTNLTGRTDSDIKKFIERTNRAITSSSSRHHDYFPKVTSQPSPQPPPQPPLLNNIVNNNNNNSSGGVVKNLRLPPVSTTVNTTSSVATTAPVHSNLSPNGSSQHSFTVGSPINCTSPLSMSPLNRLQSMQPYDYRRERISPVDTLPSSTVNHHQHQHHLPSPTTPTAPNPPQSTALSLVNSSSNSMLDDDDDDDDDDLSDDDNSNMALNLSRSGNTGILNNNNMIDSVYATNKVKHLRKSANPMKRRWNPGMMSTLVTNPGSGKKRVQCNVCLKTFCDKGALKIHFSAVHLREMHKCTVEGCNMMFSSRRSRNRHSANPNPKLHTPHLRRKISPHDGRSSNPNPIVFPPGIIHNPLALADVMNSPLITNLALDNQKRMSEMHHGGAMHHHHHSHRPLTPMTPPPRTNTSSPEQRLIRTPPHDQPYYVNANDDVIVMPQFHHKRPRLSDGDEGEDASNEEEEDDQPKNLSNKEDQPKEEQQQTSTSTTNNATACKGVRKRKSLNPVRCATAATVIPVEDDHLQLLRHHYVSSDDLDDDSSSDTFLENGTEKSDDYKLEDDKDDNISSEDNSQHQVGLMEDSKEGIVKEGISGIKTGSITPLIPLDKIKREKHDPGGLATSTTKNNDDQINDPDQGSNHDQVSSSSYDESSENALKHLESLSQGNFGELSGGGPHHHHHHSRASLLGAPTLLPNALTLPLGLGLPGGGFRENNLSPKLDLGHSRTSSPLSESQPLPGMPSFREASFVGSVEVPVDKDNPRRCIACGKIFQNHFGVKTHYQNVHLRLMHKCTVEGCNAAFPSKRSRDRHSANLNLHRGLLSTSDKAFLEKSSPFAAALAGHTLRDEFLARIYGEPPVLPLSLDPYGKIPVSLAETLLNNNHHHEARGLLHGGHHLLGHHLIPGLLMPPLHDGHHLLGGGRGGGRSGETPSPPSSASTPSPAGVYSVEDDVPSAEEDGSLPCKFCQKKFGDGVSLKEHYEHLHLPEMFRCTQEGCNKIFTSQKKRNSHAQNEAAHAQHGKHHHHHQSAPSSPASSSVAMVTASSVATADAAAS